MLLGEQISEGNFGKHVLSLSPEFLLVFILFVVDGALLSPVSILLKENRIWDFFLLPNDCLGFLVDPASGSVKRGEVDFFDDTVFR